MSNEDDPLNCLRFLYEKTNKLMDDFARIHVQHPQLELGENLHRVDEALSDVLFKLEEMQKQEGE